jgi:hypothetical protein
LFDCVVGVARGGGAGIFSLDGCHRLGMPYFFKGSVEPDGVFAIVEEGTELGFGGRRDNSLDDGTVDVDGAIERWGLGIWIGSGCQIGRKRAEKEGATGMRAGLGFRQVGGITVDMEDHSTGMVSEGGIGIGWTIVEGLGECLGCWLLWCLGLVQRLGCRG